MDIRSIIDADELIELARFAEPIQSDPATHVVYLGSEAPGIAMELAEATWEDVSAVAIGDGTTAGWLIGDVDPEMGRVWWFGPFVAVTGPERAWASVADALLAAARDQLPDGVTEEEMAVDARFERCRRWASGRGFVEEEGSHVLELDGPIEPPSTTVREIADADHSTVARLHDELFPGTHTTGARLVTGHDATHRRLVVEHDGDLAGYVAVELQPDGSGYVDYLGVAPAHRRRGLGGDLVRAGVIELRRLGAEGVGLTVRADSEGARDLYVSLGFREERFVVPMRLGFSVA